MQDSPQAQEPPDDATLYTELPPSSALAPLQPGDRLFDRYRHLRELGQGAMGTVALKQDVLLRRHVAYKQIKPEALSGEDVVKQFLGEAQITAQLEHPGVVPVYSLEVSAEGDIAYAMKVVEGQTLKARLMDVREALQATPDPLRWQQELRAMLEEFLKVCDAMAYAHAQGVIHRDLKPSNIMFGKFHEVYLLDWGIAKVFDPAAGVTAEAVDEAPDSSRPMTGTPRYMSPEQIKGSGLGPRSDLFTLGLILQEIVTLQQAVQARTLPEVLRKLLKPEERPIVHLLPGFSVPPALAAIVAKATRIKSAERYASVEALSRDLRLYLQDLAPEVLPDKLAGRLLRWIRHHSAQALGLATGLLLLCALAIGGSLWAWQQSLVRTRVHRLALEQALKQSLMVSQRLDSQFGRFEALSEHLAAAAGEALQRGRPSGPLPLTAAELPAAQLPTAPFAPYTGRLDFNRSLWLGPTEAARRMTPLEPALASLLSRADDPLAVTSRWLAQTQPHSPIQWALLLLPHQASLLYPAAAEAPALLERLSRSLVSQPADSPAWGQALTQLGLLPVSMRLSDSRGQTLGRAALFVRRQVVDDALNTSAHPALTDYWLTDSHAQAIAGAPLARLPESVHAGLSRRQAGVYEAEGGLYLYQPLATSDWLLVLRFELATLNAQVVRD